MNPATKEPEPKRGPYAGAQRFGYFWASAKVTRRKGETATRNPRSNGYTPKPPRTWSAQRPPSQSRKCPTIPLSSPPNRASSTLETAFPRIAIED